MMEEKIKLLTENAGKYVKKWNKCRSIIVQSSASFSCDYLKEEKKSYTIWICGRVNAGKSSFITEFLGGDFECPSNEEACTSAVIHLSYSSRNMWSCNGGEAHYFEGAILPLEVKKMITVSHNEEDSGDDNINIVHIGINSEILRNIAIIDSPGLDTPQKNSETARNDSLSVAIIQKVAGLQPDLIIYVYDNRTKFNKNDEYLLKQIQRNFKLPNIRLLFLATKTDVDLQAKSRDGDEDDQEEDEVNPQQNPIQKYFTEEIIKDKFVFSVSNKLMKIDRLNNHHNDHGQLIKILDRISEMMQTFCFDISIPLVKHFLTLRTANNDQTFIQKFDIFKITNNCCRQNGDSTEMNKVFQNLSEIWQLTTNSDVQKCLQSFDGKSFKGYDFRDKEESSTFKPAVKFRNREMELLVYKKSQCLDTDLCHIKNIISGLKHEAKFFDYKSYFFAYVLTNTEHKK